MYFTKNSCAINLLGSPMAMPRSWPPLSIPAHTSEESDCVLCLQVLQLPASSLREGGGLHPLASLAIPWHMGRPQRRRPQEDMYIHCDYSPPRQPAFPPCSFIKGHPGNKMDSPWPGMRADTHSSRDLDRMADKVSRMQP